MCSRTANSSGRNTTYADGQYTILGGVPTGAPSLQNLVKECPKRKEVPYIKFCYAVNKENVTVKSGK